MEFYSDFNCKQCGKQMTMDDERNYKSLCYKCCSSAWRSYELAHGGSCHDDINKRHVTKEIKAMVINRDGGRCLSCNSESNLNIDHITPLVRGGGNELNNLQTLCSKCNSKKAHGIADFREVI